MVSAFGYSSFRTIFQASSKRKKWSPPLNRKKTTCTHRRSRQTLFWLQRNSKTPQLQNKISSGRCRKPTSFCDSLLWCSMVWII